MSREEVEYVFTATAGYNEVYLEGCDSTHDIWLEIKNSAGTSIADQDDQFNHGDQTNCGYPNAGDITIPGAVSMGEEYTFIVKGYNTSYGDYSVTLFCSTSTQSEQFNKKLNMFI